MTTPFKFVLAAGAALVLAVPALAHVSLEQGRAEAGASYSAVLRIGHGCEGSPTTGVSVTLPSGFEGAKPQPRPGWNLSVRGDTVAWTAASPAAALPHAQRGEFVLAGVLPRQPARLWFKVLQTCEKGSLNWSEVPAGSAAAAPAGKLPAAMLEVMSAHDFAQFQALPRVEGGWVRAAVPGQQGTGAFMRITASKAMQLVGVETPVAGTAEVHEMKMEGEVMRMRAVPQLDLPAGRTIELKPGGYHVMLMDLKQPLARDTSIPMTLLLRDAAGAQHKLEVKLPVRTQPLEAAPGGAHQQHQHHQQHKH